MLDADASDAVAAACRMLLEERRMAEYVEVVEALARNDAPQSLHIYALVGLISPSL